MVMEISSLTFMPSSSSATPLCFFDHHLKANHHLISSRINCTSNASSVWDKGTSRARRPTSMCLKAFNGSITRPTLSSNWDVSGSVAPSLPRLEELDTTNMLLRQRIVFIGTQIDDMTADFVISQLLFLDAEDSETDIKLFIHSPGGSITAGMGIYDAMKLCKADVSTVCLGLAASISAFILASGSKGKRFCMPNSLVMLHHPPGGAAGRATDVTIRVREMKYHKIKINKILSRITRKPEEQIEIETAHDKFLNPWEAKEYGLVDAVIDDGKPGLVAPIGGSAPPPRPKLDLCEPGLGRKAKHNLPSEEKLFKKLFDRRQSSDEDRGTEQGKESSSVV